MYPLVPIGDLAVKQHQNHRPLVQRLSFCSSSCLLDKLQAVSPATVIPGKGVYPRLEVFIYCLRALVYRLRVSASRDRREYASVHGTNMEDLHGSVSTRIFQLM